MMYSLIYPLTYKGHLEEGVQDGASCQRMYLQLFLQTAILMPREQLENCNGNNIKVTQKMRNAIMTYSSMLDVQYHASCLVCHFVAGKRNTKKNANLRRCILFPRRTSFLRFRLTAWQPRQCSRIKQCVF